MLATWIYSFSALLASFMSLMLTRATFPSRRMIARKERKALKAAQGTRELFDEPGKELALPEEAQPVYELYDHPAPPIPLLGASLPTAPTGYGWEIHAVKNDHGNPALSLAMLNLRTSQVVDAIEGDMVVIRRWKYAAPDTYASFYRKASKANGEKIIGYKVSDRGYARERIPQYSSDHTEILGKVMMANLITPMVDWARLITLRYIVDNPDETKCNYMLIESPEMVPA